MQTAGSARATHPPAYVVRHDGAPSRHSRHSLEEDRSLLAEMTRRLVFSLDIGEILVEVMRLLHDRFGYGNTAIFLADASRRWLVLRAAYGDMVDPERDAFFRQRSTDGFIGEAFQTGRLVRIADAPADPLRRRLLPGMQCGLCVPLRMGEEVIGILAVQVREAGSLDRDDETLLCEAAEQLAPLLRNAALYEQSERRAAELGVVAEIARAISTRLSIDSLLDELHRHLSRIMPMDFSFVALERDVIAAAWPEATALLAAQRAVVPEGEQYARFSDLDVHDLVLVRVHEGQQRCIEDEARGLWLRLGGAAQAIARREPVLRLRTAEEVATLEAGLPIHDATPLSRVGAKRRSASLLFAPLITGGEVLGILSVQSYQFDVYDNWHAQLLGTLADQTAVAANNARLFAISGEVEALRTLDKLKDEFVGTVSHELRTPLTSILGFAELLARPHTPGEPMLPELQPEQAERAIQEIYTAAGHMRGIVEDLLDLTRITQGAVGLSSEAVDVETALSEACAIVQGPGKTRHTVLLDPTVGQGIAVVADPMRLRQVVLNLLDNALRYSPPETTIRVGAALAGSEVRLSVVDQGAGLTPEHRERVFDRFWRGPIEVTSGRPGAGLGLAICRALVEAMGGRIWVESPGRGLGATFCIALPRALA